MFFFLNPPKLNVSAGSFGERIVGSSFFESNLSGKLYLELIKDTIKHLLTNSIENNQNYLENQLIFWKDPAPMYHALPIRQYLD